MHGTYSSVPIIPHVPVMKSASEKTKTRKLSRSTKSCFSAPESRSVVMHNHRMCRTLVATTHNAGAP